MFSCINAATADELWLALAHTLATESGRRQAGRRLPTVEMLHAAFSLKDPRQRWTSSRRPALNPAFALAEVVWIVNGLADAQFLTYWNRRLPLYAGQSDTYHGAYGRRLRNHFGVDQLVRAAQALRADPDSRQVALQIWDPKSDLPLTDGSPADQDIPCNVTSLLKVRHGRLEWLQVMRSNDLMLGLPHNLIQFTSLQEVLAGWIGVDLGEYHQISDSLHVYEDQLTDWRQSLETPVPRLPTNTGSIACDRETSLQAFGVLESSIRRFIAPDLTRAEMAALVASAEVGGEFRNWLVVLASESARRRHWIETSESLISECTNPVLSAMWTAWIARVRVPIGAS